MLRNGQSDGGTGLGEKTVPALEALTWKTIYAILRFRSLHPYASRPPATAQGREWGVAPRPARKLLLGVDPHTAHPPSEIGAANGLRELQQTLTNSRQPCYTFSDTFGVLDDPKPRFPSEKENGGRGGIRNHIPDFPSLPELARSRCLRARYRPTSKMDVGQVRAIAGSFFVTNCHENTGRRDGDGNRMV